MNYKIFPESQMVDSVTNRKMQQSRIINDKKVPKAIRGYYKERSIIIKKIVMLPNNQKLADYKGVTNRIQEEIEKSLC